MWGPQSTPSCPQIWRMEGHEAITLSLLASPEAGIPAVGACYLSLSAELQVLLSALGESLRCLLPGPCHPMSSRRGPNPATPRYSLVCGLCLSSGSTFSILQTGSTLGVVW